MGDPDQFVALVQLIREELLPIHTELTDQGRRLARIEGEFSGVNSRLESLEKRLEFRESRTADQGQSIGRQAEQITKLQTEILAVDSATQKGFRRHSEQIRCIGGKADDSKIYISQINTVDETKKKMFSNAGKIVALVLTILTFFGLGKYLERCSTSAAPVHSKDARR